MARGWTRFTAPDRVTFAASIARLTLTDFRNHAQTVIEPGPGAVLVTGPNGAGKTNLLEAVSMLAPGRGLRGAALSDMARGDGPGGWAVAARLGGGGAVELGTGTRAAAPDRRVARIQGAGQPIAALGERLAILWLTPAMDRLLAEGAGARRRFLDRLVLAFDPAHARHAARYDTAMRERTRLLTDSDPPDPRWLGEIERAMAAHGAAIERARGETLAALARPLAEVTAPFPWATAALAEEGLGEAGLYDALARRRAIDRAAGRATAGPHRAELVVTHGPSSQAAPRCSTGEQKALMIAMMLAHAEVVAARRGERPVLLLDEVAAHLDTDRREALIARLADEGQVWITATEAGMFDALQPRTRLDVNFGRAIVR